MTSSPASHLWTWAYPVGSLLIGFADTFGKILLPQFAMMMIYLVMALVLIFRPSGLLPARRFSVPG